ncbi:hypothetical protein C8J57DRAFT_1467805 [Mycena rebaudengoi]|nr:hypothetical protein C8J57DRAFT_1467805 [Mycena rebaudengoi]
MGLLARYLRLTTAASYVFLVDRNLTLPSNLRRALNWSPASFFDVFHIDELVQLFGFSSPVSRLIVVRTHSPRPRAPGPARPARRPRLRACRPAADPTPTDGNTTASSTPASAPPSSFVSPAHSSVQHHADDLRAARPPACVLRACAVRLHTVYRAVRAYDRHAIRACDSTRPHLQLHHTRLADGRRALLLVQRARGAVGDVRQEIGMMGAGMGIDMVGGGGSAGIVDLGGVVDDVLRYAAEDEPLRTVDDDAPLRTIHAILRRGRGTRRGWAAAAAGRWWSSSRAGTVVRGGRHATPPASLSIVFIPPGSPARVQDVLVFDPAGGVLPLLRVALTLEPAAYVAPGREHEPAYASPASSYAAGGGTGEAAAGSCGGDRVGREGGGGGDVEFEAAAPVGGDSAGGVGRRWGGGGERGWWEAEASGLRRLSSRRSRARHAPLISSRSTCSPRAHFALIRRDKLDIVGAKIEVRKEVEGLLIFPTIAGLSAEGLGRPRREMGHQRAHRRTQGAWIVLDEDDVFLRVHADRAEDDDAPSHNGEDSVASSISKPATSAHALKDKEEWLEPGYAVKGAWRGGAWRTSLWWRRW